MLINLQYFAILLLIHHTLHIYKHTFAQTQFIVNSLKYECTVNVSNVGHFNSVSKVLYLCT